MDERSIKIMKKNARKTLKRIEGEKKEENVKLIINSFKNKWWGITPDKALELYPNIR